MTLKGVQEVLLLQELKFMQKKKERKKTENEKTYFFLKNKKVFV